MPRRSRSVISSNSYLNMLKTHLNEQHTSTYATCPPMTLYQKQKLLKEKESNGTFNQVSTASSFASILQMDWKRSRYSKIKYDIHDKQLCLWEDPPSCYTNMIMQRSLPVFEVLPPLVTDIFNRSSKKTTKLSLTKLFKCSNKKCKPSDSDIIFGDSKSLCVKCGWERSRINWLIELEGHIQIKKGQRLLLETENDNLNNICCFPFNIKLGTLDEYTA